MAWRRAPEQLPNKEADLKIYIYIYARTHNENIHIHTVGLTAIINRIA